MLVKRTVKIVGAIVFIGTLVTTGAQTTDSAQNLDYSSYLSESEYSDLSDSQKRGLEVAIEQDRVNMGWEDSKATMNMVLRGKDGRENSRNLEVKSLEGSTDGDKNITIFKTPRDVKGTVFLTYSHLDRDDEQWLYLPALKRVKRINSRNKSGPFMGSEFAFEDLVSFEVVKFEYNYLGDETFNGVDCHVVERIPKDRNSGYTKIVSWIGKEHRRVFKSDYYDRREALLKTLEASDYELYLDEYWRAGTLDMSNHQTGKSTTLTFEDVELRTGLSQSDFSKNSLKRAR